MQNFTASNEVEILESRSIRDNYADRIDVLEKVKKLSMLPDDIHVTVEMAANYYEVNPNTVKQLIHYHKDEIVQDGLKVVRGKELQGLKVAWLGNLTNLKFTQQLTLIPRRAIFRIGMLLRQQFKIDLQIVSLSAKSNLTLTAGN